MVILILVSETILLVRQIKVANMVDPKLLVNKYLRIHRHIYLYNFLYYIVKYDINNTIYGINYRVIQEIYFLALKDLMQTKIFYIASNS